MIYRIFLIVKSQLIIIHKILKKTISNYVQNKKDVFKYHSKYKFSYEKWKFYNIIFLGKCYLLKQINFPNCLNHFIFVDSKKKKIIKIIPSFW